MNINGIQNTMPVYSPNRTDPADSLSKVRDVDAVSPISSASKEGAAAIYEPSKVSSVDSSNKTYKPDMRTVSTMQAEVKQRSEELRSMVVKTLAQQGQAVSQAGDLYALLREGRLSVDPAMAAKAQEDISENGYWGVNQTSDRLFAFAQALTGGDPAKAEEMKEAVAKGFEAAKKAWGGGLPDICQKTYDATMKKFDDWIGEAKDAENAE